MWGGSSPRLGSAWDDFESVILDKLAVGTGVSKFKHIEINKSPKRSKNMTL